MKLIKYVVKIVASGCRSLMIATIFLLCPLFIGKKPMVVLSDSMNPTFSEGSLIYIEPVSYNELKEGEIISFGENQAITHRIIEKREATKSLITKGDGNSFADLEIYENHVLGKVWDSVYIPYAGYVILEMKKMKVIFAFACIMLLESGLEEYEEKKIAIKNLLY